ncbi:hypothetical protein V8E51_001152 [Hyaloscypha variabilis]
MQPTTTILLLSLLSLTVSQNSQAADGPIVPFTSVLPACASNCGVLWDVQGKCAPPNIPAVNPTCFCTDTRLTPFDDPGTSGVSQVCNDAGSCTATADLQAIKNWYDSYCAANKGSTGTTTGGSSSPTSTSGSSAKSAGDIWLSTHYKWVIMLVIIVVAIVGGWIAACYIRRRHIRRKEKEIEMRPPVAWGPHQLQHATGGYSGDGIVNPNKGKGIVDGYNKEVGVAVSPMKRESKGWFSKKNKN